MKKLKQKYRNSKTTGCPTKTFGHDRQCGFTLVELVIVIAIVIILSVVSVPIYRNYVDKAKWSEGYALLGTILSAQKAYYSEYGNFLFRGDSGSDAATFTSYEPVLGVDARGNKFFTNFCVGAGMGNGRSDMKYIFTALVNMPQEFRIPGVPNYRLRFNITTGATYGFHVD